MCCDLQPLRMLVEHRVHNVDERFVAGEEAVPAGEQVALQPALAHVFAEHLHYAAVGRHMIVGRNDFGHRLAVRDLEQRVPAVGIRLVGRNDAEVTARLVELHHIAQKCAHHAGRFACHLPGGARKQCSTKSGISRLSTAGRRWRADSPPFVARLKGPVARSRRAAYPIRQRVPPACNSASSFPASAVHQAVRAARRAAPDGRGTCLPPACRPASSARSSPSANAG